MTWYAAHLVFRTQSTTPAPAMPVVIEEAVRLVSADGVDEARAEARRLGASCCVDDPSLTLNGVPAVQTFLGVRKIVECDLDPPRAFDTSGVPGHGCEVTYSIMTLQSEADLQKFLDGDAVDVELGPIR